MPPPFAPAPGMLRRLTRAQFHNAIFDVFGVDVDVSDLDSDSWEGNFASIGAASVVTSATGVEQYQSAVEAALGAVFSDSAKATKLLGCTPSSAANDSCVRGFLQALGRRAWRRPLDSTELDRLTKIASDSASALSSAMEGAHWATVALFTSPNFLYRPELGARATGGGLRFTGYETASRLAFLLWNSLPDQQLLDDAEAGTLSTADGLRASVSRLLAAPAGRQAVGEFAAQYMRLDRVVTQAKDPSLYPDYGVPLQAGMVRDMRATWEANAFDDAASVLDLFSTTKVVANSNLALLYGLDATGLDAKTFKTFNLPAGSPRAGILGKAGFLSQFANQKEGSPTLRGKFIRDALMCQPIPPPPADVNAKLTELPDDMPLTKRQRLAMHRANPSCGGCHNMMDPLGLPLETFDAIGRYRTTDHGLPIDSSGEFDGKPVADAKALGVVMSSSSTIAECLVRRYYTYALGYAERDVDASVVNDLKTAFQTSGFKLHDLIVDTVTHDAFMSVAPQP